MSTVFLWLQVSAWTLYQYRKYAFVYVHMWNMTQVNVFVTVNVLYLGALWFRICLCSNVWISYISLFQFLSRIVAHGYVCVYMRSSSWNMYVYTFAFIQIHVMIKNGTVCMHESHWSTHVAYTLEHTHTRRSYCSIRHTFTLSLQSAQCRFQCTIVRATESFGKKWLDFLLWPWHLMRAMDSRFRGLLLLRQRQWCSAPPGRLMSHWGWRAASGLQEYHSGARCVW
jgi:hypothetical protein